MYLGLLMWITGPFLCPFEAARAPNRAIRRECRHDANLDGFAKRVGQTSCQVEIYMRTAANVSNFTSANFQCLVSVRLLKRDQIMADFTDSVKQYLQAADGYPVALVTCTFTSLLLIWAFLFITPSHRYVSRFPVIEPTQKGQLSASFSAQGAEMIARGLKTLPGLFQVMTGTGPVVVLPNRFADEIRNNKSLSFNRYFDKDFFVNYPGFEAYRTGYKDGTFIQEVVRTKLTQSLGLVTKDLVDEMTDACQGVLGHDAQFHEIYVKQATSKIVAKLSSRVFLGKNLARNDKWLRIAASYTHDSYSAAHELRQWNVLLRPFVFSFLPNLRRLRREVQEATSLIMPEVALRKAVVDEALAAGQKAPKSADAIGWMHEISRGRQVNYVHGQLFLSFAAIHTTTETITGCLFDICYYPQIVQPLREEIIQVLGQEGWSRTALHKLKLMDSFMKESQRRHPMGTSKYCVASEMSIQHDD